MRMEQGLRARSQGSGDEKRRPKMPFARPFGGRGTRAILMLVALAAGWVPGRLLADEPDAAAIDTAIKTISVEKLQHFVNILADDPFEGRETGSRGGRAAGSFLEEQLEKLHLEAAGPDGHYF